MNSRISLVVLAVVAQGCGFTSPSDPESDGGTLGSDAGFSSTDAGAGDAGVVWPEPDSGTEPMDDAGVTIDAGPEMPLAVVPFSEHYGADNFGNCNKDAGVTGFEPAMGRGEKYPLFLYLVGTLDNWGYANGFVYTEDKPNHVVLTILQEAASKGFVAVSVEYDNFFLVDCGALRAKTHCMFDPMDAASAVARLCARSNVDCEKGVVTAGHSQGSQLAAYAKNWNSRVRATWGLGVTSDAVASFGSGDQPGLSNGAGTADDRCLRADRTAIPNERMRLVNGLNEVCFSTSVPAFDPQAMNPSANCGPASSQQELERISGHRCNTDSMSCLDADGSGWLIVPNAAVEGGSAHHTWFGVEVDAGVSRTEVSFSAPSVEPWSVGTNVEWLKTFTGAPDSQPVRIDTGANWASDGLFSKDDGYELGVVGNDANAAIDVSAANAAPELVYRSYRFAWLGQFSYTLRGFAPNSVHVLRLHFAELFFSNAGQRSFNVVVQGLRVESELDVIGLTGAKNTALVRSHTVTADGAGVITIDFSPGSANVPMVSGIEVLAP